MNKIPYGRQVINNNDIEKVVRVLKSDLITQGPLIIKFEEALCRYTGSKYAVALSNGTAALHLACLAAGIQKGDEVITSPITFVASANCAFYCGAKPIFVDVEPHTGNIDSCFIDRAISHRTKAIIPVHFAGHPCDMRAIHAIARKKGLCIIEDAAHALGSDYRITKIGSNKYADMTILSFHPVKAITTGEGGAILTNSKELYKKICLLRSHGITKDAGKFSQKTPGPWYYEMQELGFNYRITDFQCALGISQLQKIDMFISRRRFIAKNYNDAFMKNPYFHTPIELPYARSAYHLYPIRLKNELIHKKKVIFNALRGLGLMVNVHYIPVYWQPFYVKLGYKLGLCPQAEKFYKSEISLPIYPSMKNTDIRKVIRTVFLVMKKVKIKS